MRMDCIRESSWKLNVAGEGSKFGFKATTLRAELESLLLLPRLSIEGLMCIPPLAEEAETSRKYFVELRELRDALEQEFQVNCRDLSMGMTNDYSVAVEEGATLVGSAPPFSVNESEGTRTCSLRAQRTFCPLNFAAQPLGAQAESLCSGGILLNSILNGFGNRQIFSKSVTSWRFNGAMAANRISTLSYSVAHVRAQLAAASRMCSEMSCRPEVSHTDASFQLDSFVVVGGYALQPRWHDGHNTGIYSFQYLRRLASSTTPK